MIRVDRLTNYILAAFVAMGLFLGTAITPAVAGQKVVNLWTLMTQPQRIEGMQ